MNTETHSFPAQRTLGAIVENAGRAEPGRLCAGHHLSLHLFDPGVGRGSLLDLRWLGGSSRWIPNEDYDCRLHVGWECHQRGHRSSLWSASWVWTKSG